MKWKEVGRIGRCEKEWEIVVFILKSAKTWGKSGKEYEEGGWVRQTTKRTEP